MTDNDAIRRRLEMLNDEELISILCEKDEERWHPEVFDLVTSILESRGVSTRNLMTPGSGEIEDAPDDLELIGLQNLITVAAYFSAVEAHVDRLALEQAGLKAWVTGEYHGENYGIGSGAILQVRSEDMAAAMDILEAPPAPASALPPELADIHCPRCGSSEITEVEEVLDVLDSSSTSLSSSPRQLWLYRCAACKHEWSAK